ncbi:STM4015 family protein [Acanthopleuribacter pedis]|uniref:STM4015 family protein n=1 Tax=Acanthopleuribacter pedis TaxID=442870 RepID=A0A8J7QKE0_9BACT|nr:STM4015 family protein [Acanthopleuribacter pedis]MBO1322616.1 STM4015 family protein [Acanthopleuribacter pedis]
MVFSEYQQKLLDLPVTDFDPEAGIGSTTEAYRLKIDYDEYDSDITIVDRIQAFLKDPMVEAVQGVSIGSWDFEASESSAVIVAELVRHATRLESLRALFIGDITCEEQEVSWIEQSDLAPLLQAFPKLAYLGVRGANSLMFSRVQHPNLTHLVIESGGLALSVLKDLSQCSFPKLHHLELWFGSEWYGFNMDAGQILAFLNGLELPHLRYLGLRNCVIADDLAGELGNLSWLGQLEVLDLSQGTFGDAGAAALTLIPAIKQLNTLHLDHHYMSDAGIDLVRGLGITVTHEEKQEHDDDRYVAVAE